MAAAVKGVSQALRQAAPTGLAASLLPPGLRLRPAVLALFPAARSVGRLSPEPPEDGDRGTGSGGSGGKLNEQVARLHMMEKDIAQIRTSVKKLEDGETLYQKNLARDVEELKSDLEKLTGSTPHHQDLKGKVDVMYRWQRQAVDGIRVVTVSGLVWLFLQLCLGS